MRPASYTLPGMVLALLLSACGGGGGAGEPRSAEQWRQDIDFLASESQRIHPDLFHSLSRSDYQAAVDAFKNDVASLSRHQIFVRLKRLIALPATREDGHTLMPMFQATGFRLYPLRLYEFDDGVFVIGANPPYQDAVGKRVMQIGAMTIDQVNAIVDPLITRDNAATVRFKRTLHYVVPELLQTLGIVADAEQGEFLLEDADGNTSTLLVSPIDKEIYRNTLGNSTALPEQSGVLYMSNRSESFWLQLIDSGNALYIKYNLVVASTGSGQTIEAFSDLIASTVAANAVQKVIVDVRHNGGGNAFTFQQLLDVLSSDAIDQPGKLYVLIDRVTFSAAANFVTRLEAETGAVFVGEPTGGSLNNYGDTLTFDLPNSGFGVAVPTIYWVYAAQGDTRLAIVPDIPVNVTADDYFSNRDPVLNAVLDL